MERKKIIQIIITVLILSSGILGFYSMCRSFGWMGFISTQEKIIWGFIFITCMFVLIFSVIIFFFIYEKYIERIITKNWEKREYIIFGILFCGLLIIIFDTFIGAYSKFLLPTEIYNDFIKSESLSGLIVRSLVWIGYGLIFFGLCLMVSGNEPE